MKNETTKSIYNAQSLFFIFGLGYFVSGVFVFLFLPDVTFDIILHDSYFVGGSSLIPFGVAGFLFGVAIIYWFLKYLEIHVNQKLGIVHFLMTAVPIIGISTVTEFSEARRYYTFDIFQQTARIEINTFITIFSLVILFAQLLFVINILLAVYKRRKKA